MYLSNELDISPIACMKIFHTSDWHWQVEKIERCQKSADFIVKKLAEIKPDIHIITGDYWDRKQSFTINSAIYPAIYALERMAGICPIVLIKGNNEHDAEGSIQILSNLNTLNPIYTTEGSGTLFIDTKCREIYSKLKYNEYGTPVSYPKNTNLCIHLMPYPTKQWLLKDKDSSKLSIDEANELILQELRNIFLGMNAIEKPRGCKTVFAGHFNMSGSKLSSGQILLGQDIMIGADDLMMVGADLYMLGHIHECQSFKDGKIWYSGNTYHSNFGEVKKRYCLLHELTDAGLTTTKIEIPSTPLSLHDAIYRDGNLYDEHYNGLDWRGADLRVRVSLTKEQHGLVDDESIKKVYEGANSYQIERITIPDERVRSERIQHITTLKEKVVEYAKTISRELNDQILIYADETEAEGR